MLGTNFDPFNQQPKGQRPIAGTPADGGIKGPKTTGGKVLRYMFNPEIGEDIKNLRSNHSHFLTLIANIFLQTGLIDASYPGFRDPEKMGLRSLLEEGYRNLRFTREYLPQILLYFSFVGSLVVIGLSMIFFMISLGANPGEKQVPPAIAAKQLREQQDKPKILHSLKDALPQK